MSKNNIINKLIITVAVITAVVGLLLFIVLTIGIFQSVAQEISNSQGV